MTLDAPDALLFDQTVTRIAGDLRELGDTETLDVRRAARSGSSPTPSTPWTCSVVVTLQHPATAPGRARRIFTCTSPRTT